MTDERASMIAHLHRLADHHEGPHGLGLNAAVALRAAAASLHAGEDQPPQETLVPQLLKHAAALTGGGVTKRDILGTSRVAVIVRARFAAAWCLSTLFGMGDTEIGRHLGRDSSSVRHAIERAEDMRRRDLTFRRATDALVGAMGATLEQERVA